MYSDQRNGRWQNLQNQRVRFCISDVYVPQPSQILAELHGRELLDGRVIEVSEGGEELGAFAVIEVEGLRRSVVVPIAKIVNRAT